GREQVDEVIAVIDREAAQLRVERDDALLELAPVDAEELLGERGGWRMGQVRQRADDDRGPRAVEAIADRLEVAAEARRLDAAPQVVAADEQRDDRRAL